MITNQDGPAPTVSVGNAAVLTEREVRQLLRLRKITLLRVRQRDDRGGLPFVQLSPGRIGYLRRDIDAYLAACRIDASVGWQAARSNFTFRAARIEACINENGDGSVDRHRLYRQLSVNFL